MSFTRFFVQRPIFAVVLSFILMIVGGIALSWASVWLLRQERAVAR